MSEEQTPTWHKVALARLDLFARHGLHPKTVQFLAYQLDNILHAQPQPDELAAILRDWHEQLTSAANARQTGVSKLAQFYRQDRWTWERRQQEALAKQKQPQETDT